MIYLDTHVVVWLYAGQIGLLSPMAVERIEAEDLYISPIVQLELAYLREIDRLTVDSALIIESLSQQIGLTFCNLPFASVILESIQQSWTRDPFDRVITAQAIAGNAHLLTKDRHILEHCPLAIW
ncbi:MAG: type II toxin-antitoxin system VapC family toxin [Kiritimatiellia bacterium]